MIHHRREIRSIALFLVAGLIAFGVDYGVFRLVSAAGAGPAGARGLSWMAGVSTTFSFHILVTFPPPRTHRQAGGRRWRRRDRYLPYVATQAVGGVINVATFLALLPLLRPLLSLAVATLVATSCNYLGARSVLGRQGAPPCRGGFER